MHKCDLTEALRLLLTKDTLPLHIFSALLVGAVIVFKRHTESLLQEVLHVFELCPTEKKKPSNIRASLLQLVEEIPDLVQPLQFTPIDISQYVLSFSSSGEIARRRFHIKNEDIDLIENKEQNRLDGSLKSDSFGPQNDFEQVLDSALGSLRVSLPPTELRLDDLQKLEPITPHQIRFPDEANATTVKRKKKRWNDRVSYIEVGKEDSSLLNLKAPHESMKKRLFAESSFLPIQLAEGLINYCTKFANPVQQQQEEEGRPQVKLEEGEDEFNFQEVEIEALGRFSQQREGDPLDFLPDVQLKDEINFDLLNLTSPKIEDIPQLAEITMPGNGTFEFEEVQRENETLKPGAVFFKLLEMVKVGRIELEQSGPFAPLQIRVLY